MSREILGVEQVRSKAGDYTVVMVQSDSNPDKYYRVDVVGQRCDCPAWKFQKAPRKPCKHLRDLGFKAAA